MAQIDFTVIYSGDNFERGAVSVRDLAPALVSLADLLAEADKFLNGSRTSTEVKVFPDFTEGSFEVHLLLSQISTDTAIAVFSSFAITDPNGLLTTVFDTAKGVLAIFKLLKGKKPEQGQITVTENYGTVNVNNVKITVDASAATLYSNDRVRESVDHFAESIATRSLDEVQVVKDGKLIGELTRDDLPVQLTTKVELEENESSMSTTKEMLLNVVTANFEEGKWRFSDGASKFNAQIADPVFIEKLDRREEGFYKGDVLRVELRTEQHENANGKLAAQHTIDRVLEHRSSRTRKLLT